jgi:hypothetical protein
MDGSVVMMMTMPLMLMLMLMRLSLICRKRPSMKNYATSYAKATSKMPLSMSCGVSSVIIH